MQKQKGSQREEWDSPFKLYNSDLEDLFLIARRLPKSLVDDFLKWAEDKKFRNFLYQNIFGWFHEAKDRIAKSAAKAHQIIDNLLSEKIPLVVIEIYLELLNKNRSAIENELNVKEAEDLFRFIPIELIIDYLELYPIKLTEKEKDSLILEAIDQREKIGKKIERIPHIFKDKEKYSEILIHKLTRSYSYDIAAAIIKRYKLPRAKYEEVQTSLIENSARGMPHWEKEKFCWEMLEEVYQPYPSAIAACIKKLYKAKKPSKDMERGFAAITHRNPEVIKYLTSDIKNRLKEVKDTPKNKLQHNEFRPSDPKEYFSLPEFGVMEKDVIWVDEANIQFSVEQVFNSTIIGIDTESTVARTTLSTTYELLSIVQIANGKHIFIFDAKFLKEKPFRSEIVNEFFRNEKNTVVGHTLEADLNEDVTKLFGYTEKVKCQKIDICPIFKKLYPGQRAGLAFISKTVLGKQICKEYTLTNWDRRPLFRNQLHYAALDAEVVLKIWDILKERKAEFESKSAPREKEDKEVPEKVEEEEKE